MVFVALILFFQTVCVISTRPLQFFTITVPASFFLIALLKNIRFRRSLWFGLLVLGFFFPLYLNSQCHEMEQLQSLCIF